MKPALALTLLIAAGALAGCEAGKPVARQSPSRPVLVAVLHYAPRERPLTLPGVVKARVESDLSFRVGGRIERRLVDAGANVHKGDALAQLDASDLQLQWQATEADLKQARAALADAEAAEKRVTVLNRQGWAANADFDKIRFAADQARGGLDKAARAADLARNALAYATLAADADGVVSSTFAEPGQVVGAGTPVVRLAHTETQEAAAAIPETWYERARTANARVEFWALPGVKTAAHLRELSPNADPTTRTYAVRYTLDAPPPAARLGMSLTLTLDEGALKLARAPLGAIFDKGEGPEVWVVDPASGAVSAAKVNVAAADAESAYIASGVAEGAQIVALGAHKIEPNEKVRIIQQLAGL